MTRVTLLFALLLSQFATGCATSFVSGALGRNTDLGAHYTAVYSDGKRMVADYSATSAFNATTVSRWTEIDLTSMEWVPLGAAQASPTEEFSPRYDSRKPAKIEGLRRILIYPGLPADAGYSKGAYEKSAMATVDAAAPFTCYWPADSDGMLILVRNDVNRPGQPRALKLAPKKDIAPVLRWVAYPFAVALDVVTFPLQALYFVFFGRA